MFLHCKPNDGSVINVTFYFMTSTDQTIQCQMAELLIILLFQFVLYFFDHVPIGKAAIFINVYYYTNVFFIL